MAAKSVRPVRKDSSTKEKLLTDIYSHLQKPAAMSPEQESHLDRVKKAFEVRVDAKYRKGQLEHGGNLDQQGARTLLQYAIDESIDQVVYLFTLMEVLQS